MQRMEKTYDDGVLMLHEKENKVVAKIYGDLGFTKSIILPTDRYPLPSDSFRVFTPDNTREITDERVLKLIDRVPYKIGQCFTNTRNVILTLLRHGIQAQSYVGWLFMDAGEPIMHCFAVLDNNQIIDLSDDSEVLFDALGLNSFSYEKYISTKKIVLAQKNSVRCKPIGKVYKDWIYIGCPCLPENGKEMMNHLLSKYPDHLAFSKTDKSGRTRTQQILTK